MVEDEVDSKAEETSEFDIGSELSAMVEEKKIPKRIATKLEQKLKEKNIQITKEQLQTLVEKINAIMKNYSKLDQPIKKEGTIQPTDVEISDQKIEQTIQETKPKIVTTEDIKVPGKVEVPVYGWELDPLAEIPSDPESVIVLMKWLQHLIDKCGRDNLNNILEYYVDIGWISQDAKISLIDYSHGITEDKKGEATQRKEVTDLPSKDHIQSLIYIQKLKGRKFDRHFIDRIDGELNRITKKLDNYNLK
jgi:flagellar protein FlaD